MTGIFSQHVCIAKNDGKVQKILYLLLAPKIVLSIFGIEKKCMYVLSTYKNCRYS